MKRLPILLLTTIVAVASLGAGMWFGSQRTPGAVSLLSGKASHERLAAVLRISDSNARAIELASFFQYQALPQDAEDLRQVLDDERLFSDEVAEVLFASWWARHDPVAALGRPILPAYGGRQPWVRSIIAEWTRRDPEGAIRAVTNAIGPEARPAAVRSLLVTWFEDRAMGDPTPLLRLFPALDQDVRTRGEAVDLILRSMVDSRGIEATIAFVEALPARPSIDLRREFLGRLSGRIAMTDQVRALDFVKKHAHGAYQIVIHRYFATQWGYHDGQSAVEWAASLPPETDGQAGTLIRAWRSWVKRDRDTAHSWMRAQEPSAGLEPAFARYVGGIARSEPEVALELLKKVSGHEARRTILTNVGIGLFQRDPILGRAWMDSEDLPTDVRATIFDRIAKINETRASQG